MSEDFLFQVAENLRSCRRKKGLTQVQVSSLTGIDNSTLSKLENGSQKPDILILKTLADTYGVSIAEIIGGTNEMRMFADKEALKILEIIESMNPKERDMIRELIYALEYKRRFESVKNDMQF